MSRRVNLVFVGLRSVCQHEVLENGFSSDSELPSESKISVIRRWKCLARTE